MENEGDARVYDWTRAETEKSKVTEGMNDYEGNDRRNGSRYTERRKKKWRDRSTQAVDNAQIQSSTVRDSPLAGVFSVDTRLALRLNRQ